MGHQTLSSAPAGLSLDALETGGTILNITVIMLQPGGIILGQISNDGFVFFHSGKVINYCCYCSVMTSVLSQNPLPFYYLYLFINWKKMSNLWQTSEFAPQNFYWQSRQQFSTEDQKGICFFTVNELETAYKIWFIAVCFSVISSSQ